MVQRLVLGEQNQTGWPPSDTGVSRLSSAGLAGSAGRAPTSRAGGCGFNPQQDQTKEVQS